MEFSKPRSKVSSFDFNTNNKELTFCLRYESVGTGMIFQMGLVL